MNEAERIVRGMSSVAWFNGTTTSVIVDEICRRYSTIVFCQGEGRRMVFTPITQNTIAFKTEPT